MLPFFDSTLFSRGPRLMTLLCFPCSITNNTTLPRKTLPLVEADLGCPAGTLPSLAYIAVHLVNLLKRAALSLIDEKVHKCNTDEASSEPDEEDLALKVGVALAVVDEIGG